MWRWRRAEFRWSDPGSGTSALFWCAGKACRGQIGDEICRAAETGSRRRAAHPGGGGETAAPQERAINRCLRQGRSGRPWTFFWQGVSEGLGKWGWRNFKLAAGGGCMLDGGVHFTDLFRYHLGNQAQSVFAVCIELEGFKAQAICLAVFESSWHQRPRVAAGNRALRVEGYQRDQRGAGYDMTVAPPTGP